MSKNNDQTITYGAGRFVIDIPVSMQFSGGYSLQARDLEEIVRPKSDLNKEVLMDWGSNIQRINEIDPPMGIEKALIEERNIVGVGKWCKAALYYHEPFDSKQSSLDLLLNTGHTALWLKTRGKKIAAKEITYEISSNIARAYRPPSPPIGRAEVIPGKDSFYLRYGAIDLPFEYEESVDIVFKGHPLDDDLIITVETEVVEVVYKVGLQDRLVEMLASVSGMGFKAEKFRTRKRTVGGLKGEEVVYRGKEEDGEQALYFMWDFPGEKNSAHAPNIIITMMGRDGHLDEKLALWDAVLDSMRPAGR